MELWDAYNKNEEKTGTDLAQGDELPKGVYHLVVEVLVQHKDGTYLLVKQDEQADVYPGYEDFGISGNVLKGETALYGAHRKLQESTGIKADRLKLLYHLISEAQHAIYYGYLCVTNCSKDSVNIPEGGAPMCRWVSEEELLKFYDSDKCIPTKKLHLADYIDYLRDEEI